MILNFSFYFFFILRVAFYINFLFLGLRCRDDVAPTICGKRRRMKMIPEKINYFFLFKLWNFFLFLLNFFFIKVSKLNCEDLRKLFFFWSQIVRYTQRRGSEENQFSTLFLTFASQVDSYGTPVASSWENLIFQTKEEWNKFLSCTIGRTWKILGTTVDRNFIVDCCLFWMRCNVA